MSESVTKASQTKSFQAGGRSRPIRESVSLFPFGLQEDYNTSCLLVTWLIRIGLNFFFDLSRNTYVLCHYNRPCLTDSLSYVKATGGQFDILLTRHYSTEDIARVCLSQIVRPTLLWRTRGDQQVATWSKERKQS